MNNNEQTPDNVSLHVNGHLFHDFDHALRCVALADSPVLIRAEDERCRDLVERLHRLGRRNQQPVHQCRHPEEAERLFRSILDAKDDEAADVLGTWALHRVDAWPREMQINLHRVLERLDQNRLHGRLRHDRIPRVVVLQSGDSSDSSLEPQLAERLSFFSLEARPRGGRSARS